MRDRGLNDPRSKEEISELAEKIGARLMEKRLGGQLSLRWRHRRLDKRQGREWEMRVFLGKGGRLAHIFDDEVIQVRPHEVRFQLGSIWDDFDDLIHPLPVEAEAELVPLPGPRLRESPLSS
jgi:hypothetical protein